MGIVECFQIGENAESNLFYDMLASSERLISRNFKHKMDV
jgi:hypothetical protein